MAYQFPTPLFLNLFYSPINGGGGGMAPCALLCYANDSGVARIFQRGPKRGSKATEQGEGVDGREIFEISCIKNLHFLHIKCHY